jgi:hypothetical protein
MSNLDGASDVSDSDVIYGSIDGSDGASDYDG